MVGGPLGHYFVVDGTETRVLEIARSGQILRTFGRRGRGPGEFERPYAATVGGDSILAVMDNGQRRVVIYDLRTGKYRGSFLLLGWMPTLQFSDGELLAGVLDVDSGTAVVRLALTGDRLGAEGILPAVIKRHPMLRSGFGVVAFTQAADGIFAAFEVSQSVFRWRRGDRVAQEIPVPKVRRKGVREDLFDELVRDPSKAAVLAFDRSLPLLLSSIGPSRLGLVTIDGKMTPTGIAGTLSLTVIDLERDRVCPDITIPAEEDPRPQVTFSGDTLVVLQQTMHTAGQPVTTIRRFLVHPEGCNWLAIPRR